MSIQYLPSLTRQDGLKLVEAFDTARFPATMIAVLTPPVEPLRAPFPLYRFGRIEFNDMGDAAEQLVLQTLAANIAPANVCGIVGDKFMSLSFNDLNSFYRLRNQIHGAEVIPGSDMTVQVRGKTPHWHQTMQNRFMANANENLNKAGLGQIRAEASGEPGSGEVTYFFPTFESLRGFCMVMDSPRFNMRVLHEEKLAAQPQARP